MRLIITLVAGCLLSSCATRVCCSHDAPRVGREVKVPRTDSSEAAKVTAYVAGHRAADGFQIQKVTSIHPRGICGMPLFGTFFTFGLVATELPHPVEITVVGNLNGREQTRTYLAQLRTRTSIWHTLVPRGSDDRAIARGLLHAILRDVRVRHSKPRT